MKSQPQQHIRRQSDNLCKQLAEQYPAQFAHWLFGVGGNVKVEKNELTHEPVRADPVIYSHDAAETLHAEFQTSRKSSLPLPLRMLDYYVGLKRQNPQIRVRQVLVVLTPLSGPIADRYEDERTRHGFDVVVMSEQDPTELMKYEELLPLATLCRTDSPEQLLSEVAARIHRLPSLAQRRESINASRIFAGLRYDRDLVNRILKESDVMEESVIYQDILKKGEQRGEQRGRLEEGRHIALRLVELRCGKPPLKLRRQIEQLNRERLEALIEAAIDFRVINDVTHWLKLNVPAQRKRI